MYSKKKCMDFFFLIRNHVSNKYISDLKRIKIYLGIQLMYQYILAIKNNCLY